MASSRRASPRPWNASLARIFLAVICMAVMQLSSVMYLHPSHSAQLKFDIGSRALSVSNDSMVSSFKDKEESKEVFVPPSVRSNYSQPLVPVNKDYDAAAPKFKGFGRCHFLPSIPSHRQIPPHLVSNLENFKKQRTTLFEENLYHGKDEDNRPLYVYNPSILSLNHMDQVLRSGITGTDFNLNQAGVQAHYLASFRVSTHAGCFGPHSVPPHTRNYLGLALLDEKLEIINGTDIVTDINYWARALFYGVETVESHNLWTNNFTIKDKIFFVPRQHFNDCRLAVATTMPHNAPKSNAAESKQGLYMTCDSFLIPIAVHRQTPSGFSIITPSLEDIRFSQGYTNAQIMPNKFGDGLRLTFLDAEKRITLHGKNFNIIEEIRQGNGAAALSPQTEYYLELYPSGPHELRRINFFPIGNDFVPFIPFTFEPPVKSDFKEPNATWLEPRTFGRLDNFHWRDRGGACCIQITNPQDSGRSVVHVGVTHTKTVLRGRMSIAYQYASRLYAYETMQPFKVVAKTGLFCLGFGKPHESRGNAQVGSNEEHILHVSKRYNRTYECPSISFVSGISEHATNSSLAILSYGINDCYPRIGIIEKKELSAMLFSQF